ncbi:Mov34/MPN/PAD-1 family protein [Sphingorhabdus sp.]|uniref:Mov34/MPN/PAD-1 family protein n=1 Tax=Sphingorhabdus sp. TaxID=1902408 RepID=UPI0035943958
MPLRISRKHVSDLLRWAEDAGNKECCGLLMGRNNYVSEVELCENVAVHPETHFEIGAAVLLSRHKLAREDGSPILGYFHSHPNGLAQPSSADLENAAADDRFWVIIAGANVTAWQPKAKGQRVVEFESIPILVEG